MNSMAALPLTVVLVAVLVAAGTDLWSYRIHNALTIPLTLTGAIYHSTAAGMNGFAESMLGVIVAVGPLLIPHLAGGMGAGDLKLMAGVGAWLGPWTALHVLIVSGLATGLWSAGLLMWARGRVGMSGPETVRTAEERAGSGRPIPELQAALERSDRRARVIPFGLLIALGVVVTLVWNGWQS